MRGENPTENHRKIATDLRVISPERPAPKFTRSAELGVREIKCSRLAVAWASSGRLARHVPPLPKTRRPTPTQGDTQIMSQGQFALFTPRTKLDFSVPVDSSPLRKKQRMSSPNYPEFIEDLSPEDLRSLSEIDAAVSQNNYSATPLWPSQPAQLHAGGLRTLQPTKDSRRASELCSEVRNDPVTTQAASTSTRLTSNDGMQSSLSVPAAVGFASVRAMAGKLPNDSHRSPSPEGPPSEQDYDSWFDTPPTDVPAFVGFQSASTTKDTGFVGFASVGKGIFFQPSKNALESVKKRMRAWEADTEEEFSCILPSTSQTEPTPPPRPVTPTKPASGANKNPASPIPAPSRQISPQHTPFTKQKAFKPPLLASKTNNPTNSVLASPSDAAQSKGPVPQFKPLLLSSSSTPTLPSPSTPSRATSDSAFRTPARLGVTRRPGSTTKKFTTPFKPGMRPGDPSRAKLQEGQENKRSQEPKKGQVFQMNSPPRKPVYNIPPSLKSPSSSRKGKGKEKEYQFFDLSQSTLSSSISGSGDLT